MVFYHLLKICDENPSEGEGQAHSKSLTFINSFPLSPKTNNYVAALESPEHT